MIDEIVERTPRPSIYVITGRRGSGKDATACALARGIQQTTKKEVYSNYDPDRFKLPKGWKHRRGRNYKKDSIQLLSDSHLDYFSRDWRDDAASQYVKLASISRHRDIDFIHTTQLASLIDRQVISNVDAVVMKEPSAMADKFERREMKEITEEARVVFEGMGQMEKWRTAYVVTHTGSFVVKGIKKPAWFTEDMSKIYGEDPVNIPILRRVW